MGIEAGPYRSSDAPPRQVFCVSCKWLAFSPMSGYYCKAPQNLKKPTWLCMESDLKPNEKNAGNDCDWFEERSAEPQPRIPQPPPGKRR